MQRWINPQEVCKLVQILCILMLNMEPIKLQGLSSVELKDASGKSHIKTG